SALLAWVLLGHGASNAPFDSAYRPGATRWRVKAGWLLPNAIACPSHSTRLNGPYSFAVPASAWSQAPARARLDTKSRTSAPRERANVAPKGGTRTLVTAASRPCRD